MTVQQHVLNWLYSVLTSVRRHTLCDLCCAGPLTSPGIPRRQPLLRRHRSRAQQLPDPLAAHRCIQYVNFLLVTRYTSTESDRPASPDGASALLVHLSGTLPVNFRGSTYRFPLSIWIPHRYPREPPIIYVTPTESMVIRPGQHVDQQGQVYHPYLVGWQQFWDVRVVLCCEESQDNG